VRHFELHTNLNFKFGGESDPALDPFGGESLSSQAGEFGAVSIEGQKLKARRLLHTAHAFTRVYFSSEQCLDWGMNQARGQIETHETRDIVFKVAM